MAPFVETPIMSFTDSFTPKVTKEPDLLDGWWSSEYNFSLEHRAILSKVEHILPCYSSVQLIVIDMALHCSPQSLH
jgi:hypothetical protein